MAVVLLDPTAFELITNSEAAYNIMICITIRSSYNFRRIKLNEERVVPIIMEVTKIKEFIKITSK